jgi:SET domain-containing protein
VSHPNVKVKSSGIHGKGVFARKAIPKGEWIMDMNGHVVTQRIADKLAEKRKKVYFVDLGRGQLLDGDVKGNHARYTNHSKKPNAAMYSYWEKGKPVVPAVG